jgi:signal transduction histidine kinase
MATVARRVAGTLRRNTVAVDAAVAAILSAAALVSLSTTFELLRQDPAYHAPGKAAVIATLLVVILPLALRRRAPLVVACVVVIAFVAGRVLRSPGVPGLPAWEGIMTVWACWLALYSAVVHGPRSWRTPVVVATLSLVLFGEVVREIFFYKGGTFPGLPLNQAFSLAYNTVFIALPLLLGIAVRSGRDRQRALEAQTGELQRERAENARRAVLEERVRIARELHDVVAHHVSVMGVQAGAARSVMAQQPEKAYAVLSSIEASSRQAVVELHQLLGFLRRTDQPDDLAPQPDLTRLPELVAQAGRGRLAVELCIAGEPRDVPRTLQVSAYRVIQEALTNALKHSGGTTATVRVGYTPTALEVDVHDDGTSASGLTANPVGGHGLMGMRERVGLHGGHLRAGVTPEGGFAVHATFPFGGSAT